MYEKNHFAYTKNRLLFSTFVVMKSTVQEAMEMQSIWSKTTDLPKQKELKGNVQVENVVIGAGMAGILTAYFLQKQGKEVIVIEADKVADGQTKNTTAKITSQHGLCYHIKELPFGVTGAVCFERQAQFEPMAFIKAIAEKMTIYENTNAVFVHGHIVATNRGTIEAKNIVFATHYPFINVPGFYFLRQHR